MGWPCTCQLSKVHHARGSYLSLGMFSWQEMSCETLSSVLEPEGATWGQGDEARNGRDHHLPSYPTPYPAPPPRCSSRARPRVLGRATGLGVAGNRKAPLLQRFSPMQQSIFQL